jgi:hypothetical protein
MPGPTNVPMKTPIVVSGFDMCTYVSLAASGPLVGASNGADVRYCFCRAYYRADRNLCARLYEPHMPRYYHTGKYSPLSAGCFTKIAPVH